VTLRDAFGPIDIYLFDQLLRGRISRRDRILDAGCGSGRNLVYLLREGFDVSGLDADPMAIAEVRALAATLAPLLPASNFRVESLAASSFEDQVATVVISSAVLHFAQDDEAFDAMLRGSWRLLAPGGLFFCRLASTIGLESRVTRLSPTSRRYRLPDGSDRYLVDEAMLLALTDRLGGRLLDPLKTTLVQDQRSMTTWVLQKL
jgi:tellurite methyltransferase